MPKRLPGAPIIAGLEPATLRSAG